MDINLQLIDESGNGTILDIGANHGLYTVPMARAKTKVVAFEPHPDNLRILRDAVAGYTNVDVVPMALSNSRGSIKLYPSSNPGGHSISEVVGNETKWGHSAAHAFDVDTIKLDDYFFENMECCGMNNIVGMKVDVEGAEQWVLEGAIEVLKRFDLLIALETHQTIDLQAIYNLLDACGYDPYISGFKAEALTFDAQYLCRKRV